MQNRTLIAAVLLLLFGACSPSPKGVESLFQEYLAKAEQGDADAQYFVGSMYSDGKAGAPLNYALALKWYRRAAEQGNAQAMSSLGGMYDFGQGIHQDHAEAVRWYRGAAEQGDMLGQLYLAFKYQQGEGVPQNYVQAHKWYNISAAQNAPLAKKFRDEVAAKMTREQIAEAQKLAREWQPVTTSER